MSASFTSLGHVFYAKHDKERDHAKMDLAGWHNRASGRTTRGRDGEAVPWDD
jgi:hypothetical protein